VTASQRRDCNGWSKVSPNFAGKDFHQTVKPLVGEIFTVVARPDEMIQNGLHLHPTLLIVKIAMCENTLRRVGVKGSDGTSAQSEGRGSVSYSGKNKYQ